jgi:hypothetical protein
MSHDTTQCPVQAVAAELRQAERYREATMRIACDEFDQSDRGHAASHKYVETLLEAQSKFSDTVKRTALEAVAEQSKERLAAQGIDIEEIEAAINGLIDDGVITNAADDVGEIVLGLGPDPDDPTKLAFATEDGSPGPLSDADPRLLRVLGIMVKTMPEHLASEFDPSPIAQVNEALIAQGEAPIGDTKLDGFSFDDLPTVEMPEDNQARFEQYLREREQGVRDFDGNTE